MKYLKGGIDSSSLSGSSTNGSPRHRLIRRQKVMRDQVLHHVKYLIASIRMMVVLILKKS